ncbi:MAG: hypothetical protein Sapg2KO_06090 [Saprospiraceae bacterium]
MDTLKYFEEIEAYVEGEMPEEARLAFEEKLAKEPELKQEYDAYLATQKVAKILGLQELREMPKSRAKKRTSYRPWLTAASFTLFAFLSAAFYSYFNYRPSLLVAEYQSMPEKLASLEVNSTLAEAWQATEEGDYSTTLQLLSPDRGADGIDESANKLYVYALLESKQTSAALNYLAQIRTTNSDPTLDWYQVLAFLQAGNKTQALAEIESVLSQSNHPFYDQAQELKQKLTGIWGRWY